VLNEMDVSRVVVVIRRSSAMVLAEEWTVALGERGERKEGEMKNRR
jgi:hypothetical protein